MRDKELFVNREQCGHLLAKMDKLSLYASDLDPMAIGERWEAQHHH